MSLAPRSLRHLSAEEARRLNDVVRTLRARGLSYPAIAVALEVFEGYGVSALAVRSWCDRLGLPKNPNYTRPR